MNTQTKRIVTAALMAALTCLATMVIRIPSPLNGYLNLGDGIVLCAGFLLSPPYAFLSAAIGSALADVFSGYVLYAPATFLIKGIMALIACYGFRLLSKAWHAVPSRIVVGVVAELVMILGYWVFEGFLYGFLPSLANIPANAVQGVAGIVTATLLAGVAKSSKVMGCYYAIHI